MRRKPNLIPRMERCASYLIPKPAERRGRWRELMPQAQAVYLELGCGKGRFTAETARQNPQALYIALERVPDAMVVAMERCRELDLHNVFFIDGDAAQLRDCFAPGEVDRLYINFCDPWPSRKHACRRLTSENFLVLYRGVLGEGGEIHFKTDNRPLFEFSLLEFPKAGYALSQVSRDLHGQGVQGVMTDYEEKFHLQGVPIHRCVAARLPMDPEPELLPLPWPGGVFPQRPEQENTV
ncbi:MAG: tRNA (guanosine(46)-N7)-methyltransferase TrmB [Lawsonibacter sp.]|nr:tRNA (guanosine(46)-N7)-methyltransferase TrmB [Lawsonibacter sp.]